MVETVDDTAADPGVPGDRPSSWGDRVRFVLRGIGQLLITAGVIVLLFVVYEVYVTNYIADRAQHKVKTALRTQWQTQHRDPLLQLPGAKTPGLPEGTGIAFLYIPRLGRDFGWAIVQGTSAADLDKGPGHYRGTALPGQVGNFAVAGHRVGKGEPFLNLDHLRAGDPVIVETESKWYVYQVLGGNGNIDRPDPAAQDIPGREIVTPGGGSAVLDPVPDHPGEQPSLKLMTMTTCHPKFTASHRMVVHAKLARVVPAQGLSMPSSVAALYGSEQG
jgi:sortase A